MSKKTTMIAAISMLAFNTAWAASISISSPVTNAVVQDAITMSGACNTGSQVKADVRDSDNVFSVQNKMTCKSSKYSLTVSSAGLKAGTLRLRALQAVNGVSQGAYTYVKKNAPAAQVINLVVESPAKNASITLANQAAVVVNGGCTQGAPVRIISTDSAAKSTELQWTGCNEVSEFHGQQDLTALKDGNIEIKAMQDLNGVSKVVTVNVVKSTVVVVVPTALKILSPAANFAVTAANQAAVEISGKCADNLLMKLQATDSANKLSDIIWINCENSNFWGPINMTSLKDGNISVRAFQEVNGVMVNQYVNVVKTIAVTPPVTPALAVTLGSLASVTEGKASTLTVNKTAGTAAGSVAYQILNNASKAVISSGTLAFAAADTSKTISVLFPDDAVFNADQKIEIKVGALAALIVPVIDNDPMTPVKNKIIMGVNAHDGYGSGSPYTTGKTETIKRMKMLGDRGFKSYRAAEVLADAGGNTVAQYGARWSEMDFLLAEAKKNGIVVRPGMYTDNEEKAYQIAKRFANDIKIWELGNEADLREPSEWPAIFKTMVTTHKGIKRAAAELGIEIGTTLNFVACGFTRCNVPEGDMAFVDAAYAAGFHFDYLSWHYYPSYGDFKDQNGYWSKKYLLQLRMVADKYKKKVFLNEMNCAEIYARPGETLGTIDGGFAGDEGCYDSVKLMLTELNKNYSDIVLEVNMYELLDAPNFILDNPDYPAHERHFGMMYDLDRPKPVFDMITNEFAK